MCSKSYFIEIDFYPHVELQVSNLLMMRYNFNTYFSIATLIVC